VYDVGGKRYLDAVGGVGVVNIGHAVGEITRVMLEQAQQLAFSYSGTADNLPRQKLAARLSIWAPKVMGDVRVFFCSGGAEANEAALKLAYQYHWERGYPSKRKIIGRWQSYHGNTIGALSMSGRTSWRRMHASLLLDFPHIPPPYCYRCPWGLRAPQCAMRCAQELRRVIQQEGPENIAAFIAEPIIGTSLSAVVPPAEYYPVVRQICDEFDILLIADEVMSGVGRTGRTWGIEHWNVRPDIITSAKGIAGGYAPLGAAILSENIWRTIEEGSGRPMHSYTYGGNPLSCAVGLAVLEYIDSHGLVARAGQVGAELREALHVQLDDLPWIGDIRGKGLFLGIEIVADKESRTPFPAEAAATQRVVDCAREHGLLVLGGVPGLIDGIGGDHFELLPPYTIEESDVDFLVKMLRASLVTALSGARTSA